MDCYTSLENVAFIHLLLHGSKTTCPTALCPFESAMPHPTPSQSLQEFHKVLTWGQFCSSSLLMTYPVSVSSRTLSYADDALEYEIGAPPSTISLQRSIDHTTQWAACWHGRFSSCKTELLLVGRQTSADDQVTISMDSSVIAEVSSHKHIGITISSDLNWSAHVTQLIKKVSRRCGLLRCMLHHLPPQLSQVYFISTMFARSLNMPAHCGMEPFRQSWHFHLKSCKLVLPEQSCVHRGEHQSNNF